MTSFDVGVIFLANKKSCLKTNLVSKNLADGHEEKAWQTNGSNHILNHELFMEGFNTMHFIFLRVIAHDVIVFVANSVSKDK